MTVTHGFELIKKKHINELGTEAFFYKHIKTGAELLSLVNDDENKVFGVTFRTPPDDSTGVAHILEHSVLCGSRKYQVKEPFVELLKSSLQTFLNAMTYPDKTCYPVASQNLQDFYNLIDVYLDAVFYPIISPFIFQQEGWHYKLEDPKSPLIYKGVVFNEMKGAYSSPDNLLAYYSQQSLFPDITYGLDSGGDPRNIPDLTYEAFKEFHKKYYHPTNSRIFVYGDDNPEERLKILNEYLKDFSMIKLSSDIDLQKTFTEPGEVTKYFGVSNETNKKPRGMITVNWLLCESIDVDNNFSLQVLSYILLSMPASPLRKAIIESGLGEGMAGVGLENELRQMYFSVGLKGIDIEKQDLLVDLIINTLMDLKNDGIDPLTIEAAMNTIEFGLRENNTGSFPRGLSLMLLSLTTWLYGDPFLLISFEEPFENLKKQYALNPSFFEGMIEKYFLNNTHRTTVILKPDTKLNERQDKQESDLLKKIKSGMSDDEIQQIIENTKDIKKKQEVPDSPEALDSIPTLTLSKMVKENKNIPLINSESNDVRFYFHDIFSNKIVYLDVGLNIDVLPQEYLPYVPLFSRALLEMGTEKEDFVKFSQRISGKTGGIKRGLLSSQIMDSDNLTSWLFLRCKAMTHQIDDLFDILKDMLLSVKFDNRERFKQMALESKSRMEQGIIPAGNRMVNLRIQSHFSKAAWVNEQMGGISSLFFLRELVEKIDNNWQAVLNDLEEIRRALVNRKSIIVNVTLDEKNWLAIKDKTESFTQDFPAFDQKSFLWTPLYPLEFEGLVIPSQVNYVGRGVNIYDAGYNYNGSINVILRFLRTGYLWEKVRVQGGAYGAMCQFDRGSGTLTFVSYRDPNLFDTLDVYESISRYLERIDITKGELHKNIIGVIGDIDSYMLPDAKGYSSMSRSLIGNSDEKRQQMREEVMATSVSDLKAFASVVNGVKNKSIIKIMGGQGALDKAFAGSKRPGYLNIL